LFIQTANTEEELLLLLRKGDEAAFEKIYHLYSQRLMGNLVKLVKREELAAELLQETFVKIWNHRSQIDATKSFRSYLFRVAENLVYDFFRKASRDKKLQQQLLAGAATHYQHVEESFCNKENAYRLKRAIDALPPQRRQVFQLIKLEGRSYAEVSNALNISVSTISDHIVKASKFIRKELSSEQMVAICVLAALLFS
jgi:RNA polymerase sigma-70 factor (ECF subfamily)